MVKIPGAAWKCNGTSPQLPHLTNDSIHGQTIMQITRKRVKTSYTLKGTVLEDVGNIKYLGITITNDLRWNTHASNICTKANKTLGFL